MLFYFNPGHETAVVNGSPYYMPSASVLRMQHDLAFLPAWLGEPGDYVFTNNKQDTEYATFLKKEFPGLPQAIGLNDINNEKIICWGISPQAIHFFHELNQPYHKNLEIPVWQDEYKKLNSRETAKECLQKLTERVEGISSEIISCFYNSIIDIEQAIASKPCNLLVKAPYSSSGRGLLWLSGNSLTRKENEIIHGMLKKQHTVSLEPALNKDIDFAMQFMSDGKGNVTFAGYSLFKTSTKGAYQGNFIYSQEKILSILTQKIPLSLLQEVKYHLSSVLSETFASLYEGCIGVDMMIYIEDGAYKLHPCLEINMRYNMGYLALKVHQRYVAADSFGEFRIENYADEGVCLSKHMELTHKFPLEIKDGKIKKGYLSLCPVNEQSHYHAYVVIV